MKGLPVAALAGHRKCMFDGPAAQLEPQTHPMQLSIGPRVMGPFNSEIPVSPSDVNTSGSRGFPQLKLLQFSSGEPLLSTKGEIIVVGF
ncbi:hypothetical protein FKM82_018817 [Ascaphus truei]